MNENNWLLRQVVNNSNNAPVHTAGYVAGYETSNGSSFWRDIADVIFGIYKHEITGVEHRRWLDVGLDRFLQRELVSRRSGRDQEVINVIAIMARESDPADWCQEPLRTALLRVYMTNINDSLTPFESVRDRVLAAMANGSLNFDELGVADVQKVRRLVIEHYRFRLALLECESGQDC